MVSQDCTYAVEKHYCPANRKLEKKKSSLRLEEATAPENPAGARPAAKICKWKCLLDLLTSAKMRGAKPAVMQEGSSTTTVEGARGREEEGTCLFSPQRRQQAWPGLGGAR